jgi:GR25 family glycosyltransferase involved in LPS biosynthesis
MSARYAIYFMPSSGTALWHFGCSAIGYDAEIGHDVPLPEHDAYREPGAESQIAEPRRYGFHATLKAPFALADGATEDQLMVQAQAFAITKLIKVPAINGWELTDSQIAAFTEKPTAAIDHPPKSHLTLTRPAIGCFLSHLAVWRWLIDAGLPRALVLEDDANPAAHFDPTRFRSAVTSMPAAAELVFVGGLIMGGLADRPQGSLLARLYYFNGTFAYLITPSACRRLITRLIPLEAHIDHQISKLLISERRAFPAYYTQPHFFEPDWSLRSDCYVPLANDTLADRELDETIERMRRELIDEGRPLLPAG